MTTTLPSVSKNKNIVEMKAVTWQKDSHGLFDYETKSLSVKKYRVDHPCRIYRQGKSEILMNTDQEIILDDIKPINRIDPNQKFLTQVSVSNSEAFFVNPNPHNEDSENDNFLIVRSLKNKDGVQKGYTLEPGDILKLGRIEYAVIELRDEQGRIQCIKDLFCSDAQLVQQHSTTASKTCKICLFEEQTDDNPFISPCKCKGSCEFVHFECLKQWIESRGYKKQNGNTFIFKWKKLDCEVCQEPLPKRFEIGGKSFDLVEIERPSSPYLVLESISKEKKVSKGVYLIKSPFDEPIKLGRGHQCEIRISDISVSRLHAMIKYENGKFIIVDNNSKFGTLVKLSRQYQILQDKIAIQIGRTVLTFVLKQSQPGLGIDTAQLGQKFMKSIRNQQYMTQSQGVSMSSKFHTQK